MADPSPRPVGNIPEGLSSRSLSILKPLGGLGFRLQRYVPLGARPLAVSRSEPMRISRSEHFLPVSTVESSDPSTLIQPPLVSEPIDGSAEITSEPIQRQPNETSINEMPIVEPLKAGDILPPSPKAAASIQRQPNELPAAAPLKAGDILPPSPKAAAIQRQQERASKPAEPLKSGDIQPPSPKAAASIQRQPNEPPAAAPLKAGDILPPSPKTAAIQRQQERASKPAEPLKSGDIQPPSPKAADSIQRQPNEPPAAAPLKAGDILPPSPKAAASDSPDISRQLVPESGTLQPDGSEAVTPASDPPVVVADEAAMAEQPATLPEVQRSPAPSPTSISSTPPEPQVSSSRAEPTIQRTSQTDTALGTPADISAESIPSVSDTDESLLSRRVAADSSPSADTNDVSLSVPNTSPEPPAIQARRDSEIADLNQFSTQADESIEAVSSAVTDTSLQRTSNAASPSGSEGRTTQTDGSPSTATPAETAVNLSEASSIKRDVVDKVLAPPKATSASEATPELSTFTSETLPPLVSLPEAAPIAEAATPNVQRRESPEPASTQGEGPSATSTPASQPLSTSPIDTQPSPSSVETVIQAKGLGNSDVEGPLGMEGDVSSPADTTPSIPPLVDGSDVQRQAAESTASFPGEGSSPTITPEVTASERAVQRQAVTSATETTEIAAIAQDSAPIISRSPESVLESRSDAVPAEAAVDPEPPSSNGGSEVGSGDAIAQSGSTAVQRRAETGIETSLPQTSDGVAPAGDVQRSPAAETTPAIETGVETEPSPDIPTLEGEASPISRAAETLKAPSATPTADVTPILDIPFTVDDTSTINRATETDALTDSASIDSVSETETTPLIAGIQPSDNDSSTINRVAETIDAPPEVEVAPPISAIQTVGDDISTISRVAKTTDAPMTSAPAAEVGPVADVQPVSNDTSTISRAAETIDAPIAATPEVEVAPPISDIQTAGDETSTINRFAETTDAPKASPSEVTPVTDIQAFSDDTSVSSSTVEALDISPSAAPPAAAVGSDLVQRRVTPDVQDVAPTISESISAPDSPEKTPPVEDITVTRSALPEISRTPADAPIARQDIDLPKLVTVFKPLSVIQPFRSPNPRMTVTDPEGLAMLPSEPSEPPKTAPPSAPEASSPPPSGSVIQRRSETADSTSVGESEADVGETTSDDYSQQFPAMPSPDEVMAALAGLSSSKSPTVQRKPASRSDDTPSSDNAARETPSSVDKSPQIQRKATAQAPPTEWNDVESLFNTSKSQQTSGSTSASPPTSASSDSYSNLKPFETIQRKAAQASSDTIQRDEGEAATIATSFDESGENGASPEMLDQLVHQVYALICQRLAVERERYGLSRRR